MEPNSPLVITSYLPSIAYMSILAQNRAVVVEQYETYHKQTLRNRARILTANGVLPLTVPVERQQGNHTLTKDILISYSEPWNVRHWRAIVSAYSAAPYFLFYRDKFEAVMTKKHERLLELNQAVLEIVLNILKIECQISYSMDFTPIGEHQNDMRWVGNDKGSEPINYPLYSQVFESKIPFKSNLSIIDLLFNIGPEAKRYLEQLQQ